MNIWNLQQKMVRYWQWIEWQLFTEKSKKFLTSSLEWSLYYSDAYVLVTGDVTVTGGNANTKVGFKNCAPFKICRTEINNTFVDEADFINIATAMYNLIEYSDD